MHEKDKTRVAARTIRAATADDAPVLVRLIRELAIHEKMAAEAQATEADIRGALSGDHPNAHCLISEIQGEVAGFALYFFNFSTWTGRPGLYLEDLFVRPEHRGIGLGLQLLAALAGIACERRCTRMEWSVLRWNEQAIRFYENLGARSLDEFARYRLDEEGIARLADLQR